MGAPCRATPGPPDTIAPVTWTSGGREELLLFRPSLRKPGCSSQPKAASSSPWVLPVLKDSSARTPEAQYKGIHQGQQRESSTQHTCLLKHQPLQEKRAPESEQQGPGIHATQQSRGSTSALPWPVGACPPDSEGPTERPSIQGSPQVLLSPGSRKCTVL